MLKKITEEIENYRNNTYDMQDGYSFSAFKLLRRIGLYKAQVYPKGKTDSQGNYKYWFDIITPRVYSEIKNIDFDTSDIELYSDAKDDAMRLLLANVAMKEYLDKSGEAEKLNEVVEQGSEWGNVVWKKVGKNDYKILELNNLMVLNQAAKTLEYSDVIEYECMISSDLRKKKGIWRDKEIDELLKSGKPGLNKSSPEFYIYERNGEVNEKEYNEAMGEKGGEEDKYDLAKVIVGGTEKGKPTQILFCEYIDEKPYKEYHRSTYCGTWLRRGLYEILMDIQTRANEIGNQIARGLEWASKKVFSTPDRLIAQNILTDLQNGDIIKTTSLTSVDTRMEGLDQLLADWNRLMSLADSLANSYEVVTGENLPARTAFKLAAQQNMNANKLFDFIREKLGIAFEGVISDWILPNLLKDLKTQKILRLTADSGGLNQYYEALINDWYTRNLLSFPPHDEQMAIDIKMKKLQEIMKNKEAIIELEKDMWKDFYPRIRVAITGENYQLSKDLDSLATFIQLEQDVTRRTYLIELAMQKSGIDVSKLPKTPPVPPPAPPQQEQTNGLDSALQMQQTQMA
jgi:hypothetical protein